MMAGSFRIQSGLLPCVRPGYLQRSSQGPSLVSFVYFSLLSPTAVAFSLWLMFHVVNDVS